MKYIATIEGRQIEIEINTDDEIIIGDEAFEVDFQSVADQPVYSMILNGESYEASIYVIDTGLQVLLRGQLYDVTVEDERQRRLRRASGETVLKSGDLHIKAPMPGLVIAVPVVEEQDVEQGQNLVILESMKMQNEIKAPRDGKISRIRVKSGDSVDQNQIMLTLG
jgi:biotin carboxyl carrier protein